MFRSLPDHHHHHHQGIHAFLVKVTELIYEYSCVVMPQHNITYIHYMLRCGITTHEYSYINSVTLTRNA
jgi:hypothetical protein